MTGDDYGRLCSPEVVRFPVKLLAPERLSAVGDDDALDVIVELFGDAVDTMREEEPLGVCPMKPEPVSELLDDALPEALSVAMLLELLLEESGVTPAAEDANPDALALVEAVSGVSVLEVSSLLLVDVDPEVLSVPVLDA